MATAAAPYVRAKLAAVDATLPANMDGSVTFTWMPSEDKGAPGYLNCSKNGARSALRGACLHQ